MPAPAPWLPENPPDFMQGESRERGAVWHVKDWNRWSDKRKLRALRDIVKRYGADPHMRWYTVNVLRQHGAPVRGYKEQSAAILRHVQDFYYTNETGEQIQTPWRTIAVKTGDCDDLAVLVATMAESIRLPWRFVLAGQSRGKPCRVAEGHRAPIGFGASHIYCDLGWPPFSEGKFRKDAQGRTVSATTWAAAEPTIKGVPLGYDVVRNGLPRGLMPELAGVGDGAVDVETPGATSWWSRIPWRVLVIGTVQGVASGLVLRWLLASIGQKRITL